ncbi:MAG TPA: PKD domain-containing protein [Bacteroidales bacterium]|nr:PKD domain-containing protein [Bacteroidales bacterium]
MKKRFLFLFLCCFSFVAAFATGGNLLSNSNMETQGAWQISFLNTVVTQNPTATWGYTAATPQAGVGGGLRVLGVTTAGNAQLCIYQAVTLSADSVYDFDAAFKNVKLERAWCEVFIGKIPVEGQDYGDALGTKIANYGSWDNPAAAADGTFKLNATSRQFAPPTTGVYYFVLKIGTTTWDGMAPTCDIIVDELKLTSTRVAPMVGIMADVRSGFAPLTVKFTDKSKMANSWLWDFGDGSTSTVQNPTHTYAAVGKYTVKLSATNEIGTTEKTETDYISVTPLALLTGGGLLKDGNMENGSNWTVDFLNTGTNPQPVATWNYTTSTPNAGRGGCLLVEGAASAGGVQFAIYQKVHLSKDSVYVFDGAFRDLGVDLKHFWTEIYLGSKPAGNGSDYGTGEKMIAKFDAWNAGSSVAGLNGTFKIHAGTYRTFTPDATGDFYFVVKMGTWDGSGFTIALDELSLTQTRTKPAVSFTASNAIGFPTLKTVFTNTTKFANSYVWDFGDGTATSTLENPEHSYTVVGTYHVKLTATNEKGDSILIKNEFVKVNAKPTLPPGEMLYGGNMENGNFWSTNKCNPADISTFVWNSTNNAPTGGLGGNLHVQTAGTGFNTAIYQEVNLKAGYTYLFDGFYKDVKGVTDFWCEGYIGTVIPSDGVDYTATQGTKIFAINTWASLKPLADLQFSKSTTVTAFKPTVDGTYYFVIKMGSQTTTAKEIVLDELTLKETLPVKADFYAETVTGNSPLTIQFFDLSTNATSWSWDFGDGGTSTVQDPIHTYTSGGTFTVKLTASNSGSSDVLISTNLITVVGPSALAVAQNGNYSIYTKNQCVNVEGVKSKVELFDLSGRLVQAAEVVGNYHSKALNAGMYIIKVDGLTAKISVK